MSERADMAWKPGQIIRATDGEIADVVLRWLGELRRAGVELAVLEGLPGTGKSTILSRLKQAFVSWYVVELDDFLHAAEDQSRAWAELVTERGAREAIGKWAAEGVTLVEGAAAWPVVRDWANNLPARPKIARAYLKQVTCHGDVVLWDDGEDLLPHAKRHERFLGSIYEYHGLERPWETADVVFERITNPEF